MRRREAREAKARQEREEAKAARAPAVEAAKAPKQRIRELEAEETPLIAEAEAEAVEQREVQERVSWAEKRRERARVRDAEIARIAAEKAEQAAEIKRIYADHGLQEAHERAALLYPDVRERARATANNDPAIPSEETVKAQALGKLAEVLGVVLPAKLFHVEYAGAGFFTSARLPEFNLRLQILTEWDQGLRRWTSRVTAQAPEAGPTHFYDIDSVSDLDVIFREQPVR